MKRINMGECETLVLLQLGLLEFSSIGAPGLAYFPIR